MADAPDVVATDANASNNDDTVVESTQNGDVQDGEDMEQQGGECALTLRNNNDQQH